MNATPPDAKRKSPVHTAQRQERRHCIKAKKSRWLGYETGRVSALHAVAAAVARLRPDDIARQVARVADRLALDYDIVTSAVADAVSSAVRGHLNLNLPAGGH
jgi:hypothetical protein